MGAVMDLGEFGPGGAPSPPPPRRAWRLAGYGILALVLLAAGYAALDSRGRHKPAAVVSPQPSVSNASDTGDADVANSDLGQRDVIGAQVPTGLLPANDTGSPPAGVFACGPLQALGPADILATAFRDHLFGSAPVNYGLVVLPTPGTAVRTFAQALAAAPTCLSAYVTTSGGAYAVPRPGLGDEAFTVLIGARPAAAPGPGAPALPAPEVIVVRVGSAILEAMSADSTALEADLPAVIPALCLFNPVCGPRDGDPAALTALTQGGTAWAAVLAVGVVRDKAFDEAIVMAARLGYRTSVAWLACDRGVSRALNVPESGSKLVAVYFADEASATRFAALVKGKPTVSGWLPEVTVVRVQTYCVAG